jgi:hypothetical protein
MNILKKTSLAEQAFASNPLRKQAANEFDQSVRDGGLSWKHRLNPTPDQAAQNLIARAQAWNAAASRHGLSASSREDLLAVFGQGEGYDCRWFWATVFDAPQSGALVGQILDAGFPVEAPVAFAHGTLLCLAAVCGDEQPVQALLERGAHLLARDQHGGSALDNVLERAAENPDALRVVRILAQSGPPNPPATLALDCSGRLAPAPGSPAPLGWSMLGALGRDWDDVAAWRGAEHFGPLCSDIAWRLDQARQACGFDSMEEFTGPLDQALERFGLPQAICAAWKASAEAQELASQAPQAAAKAGPARI